MDITILLHFCLGKLNVLDVDAVYILQELLSWSVSFSLTRTISAIWKPPFKQSCDYWVDDSVNLQNLAAAADCRVWFSKSCGCRGLLGIPVCTQWLKSKLQEMSDFCFAFCLHTHNSSAKNVTMNLLSAATSLISISAQPSANIPIATKTTNLAAANA